ncbi:MAG: phycobilisome rod-core linker polypeptide [Cyanobacteria bacterium J06638_20]
MVNTFINPLISPEVTLGVRSFDETDPVRLLPGYSASDVEEVLRAVYRQVLGNAHVMDSERLLLAESQLKQGDISVREFVRQVAQSDLYRSLFFETCPRIRSIELNFKHLLGRAPESYEEIAEHSQYLDQEGFTAEIDSYLNSDEYLNAFGEDTVPYYRGYKTQTGKNIVGFTHLFQLLRGAASSDKDLTRQNRARLNTPLMANRPSAIAPIKGAPLPWQRPAVATDFRQLIRKAVGLATDQPNRAWTQPVSSDSAAVTTDERQVQFYQAYQPFKDAEPIELYPGCSAAEADVVIRAVYRQVLGNAHVMESERLTAAESQLKLGNLSVREFVRQLAKSELYRSRFFDDCYRYRAIELNFKHLLGRAPDNFGEMRYHSTVLDEAGFEADIDTYLDSDEYQTAFGESIVPYYRGYTTQPGQSMLGFTNMLQLLRSASSSDKNLATRNQPQLTRALIQNSPYGKLKVRDAREILAEVFKPKYPFLSTTSVEPAQVAVDYALQQTVQEQAEEIQRLQQTLADLRPFAAIGAAQLKDTWQPSVAASTEVSLASLHQQADAQSAQIKALQEQIADARRYAAIGEARLNKWRSRTFNG